LNINNNTSNKEILKITNHPATAKTRQKIKSMKLLTNLPNLFKMEEREHNKELFKELYQDNKINKVSENKVEVTEKVTVVDSNNIQMNINEIKDINKKIQELKGVTFNSLSNNIIDKSINDSKIIKSIEDLKIITNSNINDNKEIRIDNKEKEGDKENKESKEKEYIGDSQNNQQKIENKENIEIKNSNNKIDIDKLTTKLINQRSNSCNKFSREAKHLKENKKYFIDNRNINSVKIKELEIDLNNNQNNPFKINQNNCNNNYNSRENLFTPENNLNNNNMYNNNNTNSKKSFPSSVPTEYFQQLKLNYIKPKDNNYKNFNPINKIVIKPDSASGYRRIKIASAIKRPNSQQKINEKSMNPFKLNLAAKSINIINKNNISNASCNNKLDFLQKALNLNANSYSPSLVLKKYKKVLTKIELEELSQLNKNTSLYYLGSITIRDLLLVKNKEFELNILEDSWYNIEIGDHVNYQYEIQELICNGEYGKIIKCFDHKNKQLVHIKVMKNIQEYTYQSNIEIRILQHIKEKNWDNRVNIVKLLSSFMFRGHNVLILIYILKHLNYSVWYLSI